MIENGSFMYQFQTGEDAIDACKALKDGYRSVDTCTVLSKCRPNEAEARLRTVSVQVSGVDRNGNPTGEPKTKTIDLFANIRRIIGPDGIDVDLGQRVERAIEDAELERNKGKLKR